MRSGNEHIMSVVLCKRGLCEMGHIHALRKDPHSLHRIRVLINDSRFSQAVV